MPDITIGALGDTPVSRTNWDSVWIGDVSTIGGHADWIIATAEDDDNIGGLRSTLPVETAILICLFTDRRLPDDMVDPANADRRGWHGDTFDLDSDLGERPMGSLLWTLDRATLSYDTARMAEHFAAEALQTLIDQGMVGRFDINAEVNTAHGMLVLHVKAIGPDNQQLFRGALSIF